MSSITRKSATEIAQMRRAGAIVAEVLARVEEAARPGASTAELDAFRTTCGITSSKAHPDGGAVNIK